jgi:hypothetical protein
MKSKKILYRILGKIKGFTLSLSVLYSSSVEFFLKVFFNLFLILTHWDYKKNIEKII